jgi:hypothetical protein
LARSVEGFATYFSRWALVWERQAMIRARPVAGDMALADRFMALLDDFVWGRGLSDDEIREIRRIKARVERERIPPTDDPKFHLKLGRGSLSDIEFTAQLLQPQHDAGAGDDHRRTYCESAGPESADHDAHRGVPVPRTHRNRFLTSGGSMTRPAAARAHESARGRSTPRRPASDYRRVTDAAGRDGAPLLRARGPPPSH